MLNPIRSKSLTLQRNIIGGNEVGEITINGANKATSSTTSTASESNNLLINSNFLIWQRVARVLTIDYRERTSNVARLDTDIPHGYLDGDEVQIYSMSDGTYDETTATVTYETPDEFSYANTGSDESSTAESGGLCVLKSRPSLVCADTEYFADRWYCLRADDYSRCWRDEDDGVEITTTSYDEKFGIIQIVPYKELEEYLDSSISLSMDVLADTTAKAYISLLAWDGTADAPTKDVVSSWGVDETDPTLVTDWTHVETSDATDLTSSFKTISLENLTIPDGTTNIAIFVWVDSYADSYSKFSFRNAQILPSDTLTDYKTESYLKELTNCLRFYQKSYNIEDPPYKITDDGKYIFPTSFGTGNGGYYGTIQLNKMYKTPTITLMSSDDPPEADKWAVSTGSNVDVSEDLESDGSFVVKNDAGFTISTANIGGHYTCDAEI